MYQRLLSKLGYLQYIDETGDSFGSDKCIDSQEYVHDIGFYDGTITYPKSWISTDSEDVSENSDILANDKTMEKEIPSQNYFMARKETNNKPIQQERNVPENLLRVSKDQPLLAPDKRQDKDFCPEPIPSGDLDWNKVFTFLVNIIEPSTWRLFFVELFGYGEHLLANGQTTNSIIEHIKLSNNGASSELFFDLFQKWLRLMGSEAKPSQIETALEARMDNLALSKFRQFMR
ncbi:uncharacterized protein LOC132754439 [Ruditapes philippinarum]|uniref:uncharacterized protein LOC132754439 n=1 Tax=Ruditapes philippinarum TaxID=129788 RepID=UPI00295A6672|nr:uncharacterized protein LOC132754439 [Ruditapes philippinarum]